MWHCGEPAISLHSHHVSLVQWTTWLLPVTRDPGSNPQGVLMWNRDSPVSVVSLHWWPRRDWSSLWPCLRRASSQTITRLSCRQCDNSTWSHTAFLFRFPARCMSPFRLHNQRSRLLGGSPVESLQSHFILTMSHWSSGLPDCFPSQGTQVQIPRGYLCETRILLLALSRYIGDPDVIDHHCGLVWGGPRPEPSLGSRADNVIIPLDLTQLSCSGFLLAACLPSGFTINGVGC